MGKEIDALPKNREELEQRVIAVINEQFGKSPGDVTPDSEFLADLNPDSLDLVELAMELEDKFGVTISDEDQEKLVNSNVRAAIIMIAEKIGI